jgi:hypothetical protein
MRLELTLILAGLSACGTATTEPLGSSYRIEGPPDYTVYWDLPVTDRYWLPKGTSAAQVVEAGKQCGATVDGGMWHHIPVPPEYDWFGFYFVGTVSDAAKACVITRLKAVPALTVYPKKR